MTDAFHLFTIGRIPVFAQGGFLVLLAISGMLAGGPAEAVLWCSVVTFSILVHEFGHGIVARHYGLQPAIVLHAWGGLCAHQRADRDAHDALIVAAGPGAGLVLGFASLTAWVLTGIVLPDVQTQVPAVHLFFKMMVWVNIGWSLLNLVPLWPLDGGQLYRLAVIRIFPEALADRIVHGTGVGVGVLAMALAVFLRAPFAFLLAGMFAWQNLDVLRGRASSPPVRRSNRHAETLLTEARDALLGGRPKEALRLAHQIRAEGNVSDAVVGATWEILVVGSAAAGQHEEALRYARYAPDTAAVRSACAAAEAALGRRAG